MQLFGRCARQGQDGSVRAIVSLEDDIIIEKCPKLIAKFLSKIIGFRLGQEFSLIIYKIIQYTTDKSASKRRRDILANDFSMSRNLSFSSK